jgi:hypothetical protein
MNFKFKELLTLQKWISIAHSRSMCGKLLEEPVDNLLQALNTPRDTSPIHPQKGESPHLPTDHPGTGSQVPRGRVRDIHSTADAQLTITIFSSDLQTMRTHFSCCLRPHLTRSRPVPNIRPPFADTRVGTRCKNHEENLSTQQPQAQAHPWLPRPYGYARWS